MASSQADGSDEPDGSDDSAADFLEWLGLAEQPGDAGATTATTSTKAATTRTRTTTTTAKTEDGLERPDGEPGVAAGSPGALRRAFFSAARPNASLNDFWSRVPASVSDVRAEFRKYLELGGNSSSRVSDVCAEFRNYLELGDNNSSNSSSSNSNNHNNNNRWFFKEADRGSWNGSDDELRNHFGRHRLSTGVAS
ncbi:unnamed protein product [Polarella glacialis]|uniref:Uncharacterized protein n=1 Tax=Polarella glacialis TaxID=89957 RepID=A0A813KUY2_POLGL|nr:unnamed protein product [Polarella glacialis]